MNSSTRCRQGGAFAIRDKDAHRRRYRILSGQSNCSRGEAPWSTWLSCDDQGQDCDIFGQKAAVKLPALGTFSHEAACVDPIGRRVYETEDEGDSGSTATPDNYPDLTSGLLEVAIVDANGLVTWAPVPDPSAAADHGRFGDDAVQARRGPLLRAPVRVHHHDERLADPRLQRLSETMEVLWTARWRDPRRCSTATSSPTPAGGSLVCEDQGLLRISTLSAMSA